MTNKLNLQAKFEKTFLVEKLIFPGERIFVACSGGPDSIALLHLLAGLAKQYKLKLSILHIDHGLRGKSSKTDALFVEKLARKMNLPFLKRVVDVKAIAKENRYSMEEAAREGRYEAFQAMVSRYKSPKIAVAHNLNDQAETVMMRMIQGTGIRGLLGIRKEKTIGKVKFVRPLLHFKKEEILQFLDTNKFKYRKDKTNLSTKMVRNKIRLDLLPFLEEEFNPRVMEALARIPSIYADEQQVLNEIEERAYQDVLIKKTKREVVLSRSFFLELQSAIQFRVLNRILKILDHRSGIGFDQWCVLREELTRKNYRHSLLRDIDISINQLNIRVYKKKNVR